jgi:mannose-6-phosphate isomerase-like protein (cupin superfamily)
VARVIRNEDRTSVRSLRDNRRRVDLVTEELLGITSIQADVVINQPGDRGSEHKHVDADHIFIGLTGGGIMRAGGEEHHVGPGDVVHIPMGEYHEFENTWDEVCERIEIWIPAPTETIWRNDGDRCTWEREQ